MGSKLNLSSNSLILCKFSTKRQNLCPKTITASQSQYQQKPSFISTSTDTTKTTQDLKSELSAVKFKALRDCKLGIASYPDFEYNAEGGKGNGSASNITENDSNDEYFISFDLDTLYIPPLMSSTTKFLGLPLPPLLNIRIEPELFQGNINKSSGKVELEFKANFWFSVGSIYKAPPLVVVTVLTSEESAGKVRRGKGVRLDKEGKCRLVGVATVDPIDDFLMNSFLGLPNECLADLSAIIAFSNSSSNA